MGDWKDKFLLTILHQVVLCARKSKSSPSPGQGGISRLVPTVCKQEKTYSVLSQSQTVTDCCDLFCFSVFLLKMLVFLREEGAVGLMEMSFTKTFDFVEELIS